MDQLRWEKLRKEIQHTIAVEPVFAARFQVLDGLSNVEMEVLQSELNLSFPPDLRAFLKTMTVVGDGFVDWRADLAVLRASVMQPREAWFHNVVEFVAQNPNELQLATAYFQSAPWMVPVRQLDMIPCVSFAGQPVFRFTRHGVELVATVLEAYLREVFFLPCAGCPEVATHVFYWSDWLRG